MAAAPPSDEAPTNDGYVAKKVSLEEMQKVETNSPCRFYSCSVCNLAVETMGAADIHGQFN